MGIDKLIWCFNTETALWVTTEYVKYFYADPMLEHIDVFAVRVTLHTGMARVVKLYLIMGKIKQSP